MTSSSSPPPLESTVEPSSYTQKTGSGSDLHQLLGLGPSSTRLENALKALAASNKLHGVPTPQVKSYSDVVYFNLHQLGLSLQFQPTAGYKPKTGLSETQIDKSKLRLAAIDVYNHEIQDKDSKGAESGGTKEKSSSSGSAAARPSSFGPFPAYPIRISRASAENNTDRKTEHLDLHPSTMGRDLVETLGEPDRKGGGTGGGSVGVWLEWTQLGLMVELASSGFDAWDKGGESSWRYCSVFERGVVAGIDEDDTQDDI